VTDSDLKRIRMQLGICRDAKSEHHKMFGVYLRDVVLLLEERLRLLEEIDAMKRVRVGGGE
jgi:hypothetical protein